jgi:type IV secretion system protein VirB8
MGDATATAAPRNLRVTKNEVKEYHAEAADWDRDRVEDANRSKRTAWRAFWAVLTVAGLEAFALAVMAPLKTVEPYVVRVDNTNGVVDQVVRLKDVRETYDEVMTKYFLRRVVTLRETYTRAQLQHDFDESMLFTAPSARPQLKGSFGYDNPNGPYKKYGESGTASIQILNVSFIANNVAQVRYVKQEHRVSGDTQSRWVATIEFRYVAQPASEEARGVNPLGFQVTNYRNDPEALAEEPKQ